MSLLEILENHWELIVGGTAATAYATEKVVSYSTNRKQKKKAYNVVFTGLIKLYHSYLKNKQIFSDQQKLNFPLEVWATITKHLTSFKDDLDEFKICVENETDIIPEISINFHLLQDWITRLTLLDSIREKSSELSDISDIESYKLKKAQFYALENELDEFFLDLIEETGKKTSISKSYLKWLKNLGEQTELKKLIEDQERIMKRYFESLYNQGAIDENAYKQITEKFLGHGD